MGVRGGPGWGWGAGPGCVHRERGAPPHGPSRKDFTVLLPAARFLLSGMEGWGQVLGRDPPGRDHLITSLRKGSPLRPCEVQSRLLGDKRHSHPLCPQRTKPGEVGFS